LDEHDVVVVEASFNRNSFQRQWLNLIAQQHNAELEYKEFFEDPHVCLERVKRQYQQELEGANSDEAEQATQYYQAREDKN
jgi:hypothetical protein